MLSQANKQFLIHLLKFHTKMLDDQRVEVKEAVNELWKLAIPKSEDGEEAFAELNDCRDAQRYIKKNIRRIANISRELKNA